MIIFNISKVNLEKVGKLIEQVFNADLSKEEAILFISIIKEAANYSREQAATIGALTQGIAKAEDRGRKESDYSIA